VMQATGFYPRPSVDTAKVPAVGQAGGGLLIDTVRTAGLDVGLLAAWRHSGAARARVWALTGKDAPDHDTDAANPLLPRGAVPVEETLAEIAGQVAFQPPKTKASRRAVVLPKAVAAALAEHLANCAPGGPRDLVFRSPEGAPMRLASWRRRFWVPAVARAGLDGFRIHDLRHTDVDLWIATGANPKQVSIRAGHTSVSFTFDRDGHLFEDADETLAGLLDAVCDPGDPN